MIRRPPRSPLFPSTPLFRSVGRAHADPQLYFGEAFHRQVLEREAAVRRVGSQELGVDRLPEVQRSEEHTSELQSLAYLVCRLLLEKKKTDIKRLPLLPPLQH